MWTAKTEAFENADVIRLFVAYADDCCSVFERCVFKRKRISVAVGGENAAKTIVWTGPKCNLKNLHPGQSLIGLCE